VVYFKPCRLDPFKNLPTTKLVNDTHFIEDYFNIQDTECRKKPDYQNSFPYACLKDSPNSTIRYSSEGVRNDIPSKGYTISWYSSSNCNGDYYALEQYSGDFCYVTSTSQSAKIFCDVNRGEIIITSFNNEECTGDVSETVVFRQGCISGSNLYMEVKGCIKRK